MPSNPRTIETITIREILRNLDDGSFNLTPSYQRGRVWNQKLTITLIETILSDSPIGMFQLAHEQEDEPWNYLDAANRTYSISDFVEGKFKVGGLTFTTLPEDARQKFLDFEVCFTKFHNMTLEEQRKKFKDIQNGFNLRGAEKVWADENNPVVKIVREVREENIDKLDRLCNKQRKNDMNVLVNIFAMVLNENSAECVNVGNSTNMQSWVTKAHTKFPELEQEEIALPLKRVFSVVLDQLSRILPDTTIKLKKNQYVAMDVSRIIIHARRNHIPISDVNIKSKLCKLSSYQYGTEIDDPDIEEYARLLNKPSQSQYTKKLVGERFNSCKMIFL